MARRIKQEIIGVCCILGSVYVSLSLVSYDRWDRSFFTYSMEPVNNLGGIVGSYVSDLLFTSVGVAAYAFPLFGIVYGLKRVLGRQGHRIHIFGAVLFVVAVSLLGGLMATSFKPVSEAGGLVGTTLGKAMLAGLSSMGAYIVSIGLFFTAAIMLSPVSLVNALVRPGGATAKSKKKKKKKESKQKPPEPALEYTEPIVVESAYTAKDEDEAGEPARPVTHEGYVLPPGDLLTLYEPVERESKEDLLENSSLLESKLGDFAVQGKVTQVYTGPVVTMFEFEPAAGVKISRVVALADDLAMSLKARAVRIAPIPGKSALGIEIPNSKRETVSLREIISSESFKKSHSKLTIALGKDIFGAPVVADLSRMPHILVAGSTGSGKSVALNSMVLSALYKATPDEIKMLMIDPKLLELSSYDGIPHLISPVITNPKEASEMLRKMVFEMERRYRLIAQKGVRNIDSYNEAAEPGEKLPYILIIIDEFADLMFASASQVEDSIARLAQMARASGMHLILATQRPSVDVITGVIKANFPARISFHVTSKIDSRTILDGPGAEQLLGKGDMLLMLPGKRTIRVHGSLVTEGEVKTVVDYIKGQGAPDFTIVDNIDREAAVAEADARAAEDEDARDEYYAKVVDYASAVGEVSISSIQRKFKIGYNRAARIMELLEEDGRVGPPRAAGKPRDFLG